MQGTRMNKLKRLLEKRDAIKALIRQEENKQRADERKLDTRRKILAGATVLEWAKEDSEFSARLYAKMNAFLVRDDDRALFSFAPLLHAEEARNEDTRPEARMRA